MATQSLETGVIGNPLYLGTLSIGFLVGLGAQNAEPGLSEQQVTGHQSLAPNRTSLGQKLPVRQESLVLLPALNAEDSCFFLRHLFLSLKARLTL